MKLYPYILHDSSTPCNKLLGGIFEFSHLLLRELIKGLSPNWSILVLVLMKCSIVLCIVIVNNVRNILKLF